MAVLQVHWPSSRQGLRVWYHGREDSISCGLPVYLLVFINSELYYLDTDAMEFEKHAAVDFCTMAL